MKTKEINHDMRLCTGCEACANACAHGALTMRIDWRGFKYPQIDNNVCVDCGLCRKVCSVDNEHKPFVFPYAKAFVEDDKKYLANASSGGAFGVIARYILGKGGIVFGACMDDNYDVNYIGVETIDDLPKIQGSKYVQAYVGDTYRQVKQALKAGRYVFFCGCACQVDGLKHYLRKDYDQLLTMDLICHGVPSQPYFKAYVKDLLKRKAKQGITTFHFRWKPETCCETLNTCFPKNMYLGFHNKDYYMTYFLWGKGYRDSCYSCRYAGGARPADFTVGDFWKEHPAVDSKWGLHRYCSIHREPNLWLICLIMPARQLL